MSTESNQVLVTRMFFFLFQLSSQRFETAVLIVTSFTNHDGNEVDCVHSSDLHLDFHLQWKTSLSSTFAGKERRIRLRISVINNPEQ